MIRKTLLSVAYALLFTSLLFAKKAPEKIHSEEQSAESKTTEETAQETEESTQKSSLQKPLTEEPETTEAQPDESQAQELQLPEILLTEENCNRPETEKWREIFLGEKRLAVLKATLERAGEYRLMVRKRVGERKLPPELEYLPVVESAYSTKVKSRSGAVGMWQFMSNSVKPYLKLTEYVDERLDPWKSTDAGLSKLEYNHQLYGDWLLAIAAYNCGNGAMKKAINRCQEEKKDFWTLCEKGLLPKQTAEYIPQLIAVSQLCTDPERFSVEIPLCTEEFEKYIAEEETLYDFVETKKPYLISDLAKAFGMTEKELKRLNGSLTKNFTPPATSYQLRMPGGKAENSDEILASITPLDFPFKYKVQKGDSLWSLSRKYGVTVSAICDTNGIKENGIIKIGQILYIPSAIEK